MEDDNVVFLPFGKKDTNITPPIKTIEDYAAKAASYQISYSQDFCERISNMVFKEMERDGIDFQNDDSLIPSTILVMESLLSLHMKANQLDHFLQEFADETFDRTPDDFDFIDDDEEE
jgi:hypothetical protein